MKVKSLSTVWLFVTPWTIAYQAPPSMGFSRQEYWSGLPFPSPGNLPNPGIEPRSPTLQTDALPSEPSGKSFYVKYMECLCNIHISGSLCKSYPPMLMFSHVWLFATPWTVAYQAPLSMGFPKQEYWSRLPFPSPSGLPCEMPCWMKHNLESRLQGEISITSAIQMTPPLWQKVKRD